MGIPTDADGRFRFDALIPGMHYRASVYGHGRSTRDLFDDLTIRPGEDRDLGDLQVDLPAAQSPPQ